jgi:uncharacterized membrane protein
MRTVMQWAHLVSAIVAVGGTAFLRFVLLPAATGLDEEARKALMGRVLGRFRPVLWSCIGVLLLTGLHHAATAFGTASPLYLNVLLVKIALALVIFGVAFALTIPGGMFAGMQARRRAWLTVNAALALVVVFLSAYLRRM